VDPIKEQCPADGPFYQTCNMIVRPIASSMLCEGIVHCSCGADYEGPSGGGAHAVEGSGHQFLSSSCLSAHQHSAEVWSNPAHLLAQPFHRRTATDDLGLA
jgi:hypothetical protein